ncbi:MAG: trypsin-like serine protease [Anaerolineae bacterium]
MDLQLAIQVKRQNRDYLLGRRNVVACGVGFKESGGEITDEPCVVVSVTKKMPEAQLTPADIVPKKLGEVRTDVQETGVIRALQGRTDRWRPAPGGVSIGHIDITAGTLGCLVTRNGQLFILSNNHVLANTNAAQKGDPIIQPGRYDGGTLDDQIATLEDFIPINFGDAPPTCPIATGMESFLNWLAKSLGSSHRVMAFQEVPATNRVDAAIARPLSDDLVEKRILEIGVPQGSRDATLGTHVKKSGRTTGFTTGQITQIDVTAQVSYGEGKTAVFEDQLMAGAMSKGGDSGSAVLDEDDFVVGLLFAGSDTTTIINPIQFVLEALNVEIAV